MKKIGFLIIGVAILFLASCQKEEFASVTSLKHSEVINELGYNVYNSLEEITNVDNDEHNLSLKSTSDFTSMWDIFLILEEYSVDSTKTTLFNETVEKYSHILKQSESGSFELIVRDPVIASRFNENGVLGLNEYVYVIEEEKVYKYSTVSGEIQLIEVFDRTNQMMLKSTSLVEKSGAWESEEIRYSVSSERKIKVSIFCESYGDLGASIGAHSSYHRKSWGDHQGDNRLQFKASKIQFTNFASTTNSHLNVLAFDNTRDRVNLYATYRYTSMDASKLHRIENPVVTFWRNSEGSGTGFVFDTFLIN